MSGLELNKIAASVLLAGLIAMVVGSVTDVLYKPELTPAKRGYEIAGAEEAAAAASAGAPAEETFEIKINELMATADAAAGQATFKKCAVCHSVEKGGPNKVGPNLWGVVNASLGHNPDFAYSTALKGKGGKWGYDELAHFLYAPQKYIPGTKMGFGGLKKPEEIANVISYLQTLQ